MVEFTSIALLTILAVVSLSLLLRFSAWMRAAVYDALIVGLTGKWYKAVLERLPNKALLLDVGCGTGRALASNADILRSKDITTIGIDYDIDYVKACLVELRRRDLMDRCRVQHISIYDYKADQHKPPNASLDAVYFSGSLMIMPSPVEALKHVSTMLKPGGRIYCTQTFEHRRSWWISFVKEALKFMTTIDFGSVTYQEEFYKTVQAADLKIEEDSFLLGTTANDRRSYRLLVLSRR